MNEFEIPLEQFNPAQYGNHWREWVAAFLDPITLELPCRIGWEVLLDCDECPRLGKYVLLHEDEEWSEPLEVSLRSGAQAAAEAMALQAVRSSEGYTVTKALLRYMRGDAKLGFFEKERQA